MTPLEETLLIWKKAEEIKNKNYIINNYYDTLFEAKSKAIKILNETLSEEYYLYTCPLCQKHKSNYDDCDRCPLGNYYGITENSLHFLGCTPPYIRAVKENKYDHMIYVLEVLVQREKEGL